MVVSNVPPTFVSVEQKTHSWLNELKYRNRVTVTKMMSSFLELKLNVHITN